MGMDKAQTVRRRRDGNRIPAHRSFSKGGSTPVQTSVHIADHFHFAFCILHFAFKRPAILLVKNRQCQPVHDPPIRVNSSEFESIRVNSSEFDFAPGGGGAAACIQSHFSSASTVSRVPSCRANSSRHSPWATADCGNSIQMPFHEPFASKIKCLPIRANQA